MNTTTDMALHNRKIWCFSIFYFSFNVIELVQIKDSHQDTLLLIPIFLSDKCFSLALSVTMGLDQLVCGCIQTLLVNVNMYMMHIIVDKQLLFRIPMT